MADVVINHRCADTQDADGNWRIFSNVTFPRGNKTGAGGEELNFDKTWGPWAIVKDDPCFSGEGNSDTAGWSLVERQLTHGLKRAWFPIGNRIINKLGFNFALQILHFWRRATYDTGDSFAAAPDLDHANVRVREELTAWLNWLKDDVGFAVREEWGRHNTPNT